MNMISFSTVFSVYRVLADSGICVLKQKFWLTFNRHGDLGISCEGGERRGITLLLPSCQGCTRLLNVTPIDQMSLDFPVI